jgi:Family of unknown function (DUF5683)
MTMVKYFFLVLSLVFFKVTAYSQQKDTLIVKHDSIIASKNIDSLVKKDSVRKKFHDPHKATLYSAILPGAGQIYNKKYWKLPIVYTALGIPAYTFFYNKTWYQKCQYALVVQTNGSSPDSLNAVDPKLRFLASQTGSSYANSALINYRNEFRKDQDYSALFFLLFWGLQIVDATVDAHLKDFNVSNDLSFQIHPTIIPGTTAAGISLVFDLHKPKSRLLGDSQ